MSLWEFNAVTRGFRNFHNPEEESGPKPPSEDEYYAKMAELGYHMA
jgi:hypothetical protein